MKEQKRILCIDYGARRVGIAITDPLRIFVYPLTTIENNSFFWETFDTLIREYDIEKFILGYPLKEDGSRSSSTELIEKFRSELEKKMNIPIEYYDERYSSELAKDRIIQSVSSKKKRRDKSLVDKNAAAIILEDYLRENGGYS
ncbi:MAG: Holliday junction resolvase RuvX [Ignavibacteriae bacterium HGW-Ignavibacteriae-2]|jgi:putative Holliday junction resolvase|nr:MAG: Holliday junction resolvase RuvX [Ignavibacteriae bacterium HGW-Ignavibacteriae-2]